MTTQRAAMLNKVKARLQAALPGTTLLLVSPRYEVPAEQLPAVLLFSRGDRPEGEKYNPTVAHPRVYTIQVEIRVRAREEEAATDDLAVTIRRALLLDETAKGLLPDTALDGLARRVVWADQQWDGVETEVPISGTRLEFDIHYVWQPE